ncbi:TetR-like C-terminal domain-containing protein [Actinomadura sp. LOL_016]|uniref:TetR-like C-terminal domain-containing protein n=1 Tax=unclassified Actinomadura TaxID=2626254 RepID=UPI003A80E2B7
MDQAMARGEAPEGTDAAEVVRAVSAPLYYRFLVSGDPLDEEAADRSAHAAACAAAAGAYVRGSGARAEDPTM